MSADGWSRKKLGEILTLEYGKGLTRDSRSGWEFPVYGSSGEVGRHNEYLIPGPSIIVGRKGSVGAVSWVDSPSWPIDTTYYVAPSEQIDLRWCYWLLDWMSLQKLDASTGVPGLNRHDAYRVSVNVPPLKEQRRIAGILDTVDAAIRQTDELIAKLQQIKAGLLHDLLTRGLDEAGRLRDPEAHPEQFRETALRRLPAGWEIHTLGDLAMSAVDGPFGSNLKTEHYVSEPGVRVVRLQNVGTGHFDDSDKAYVSEEHALALQRHEVRPGDLIVASLGDVNHPFGRACLYPQDAEPGIVKADCFRFRLDPAMATHAYVMHVLNCPVTRGDIDKLAQGVTRDRVNLGLMKQVRLGVPPTAEQVRIAEVVGTHDKRIRAEEAYRDKLTKLKQGLMQDLLAGRVRTTDVVLGEVPA